MQACRSCGCARRRSPVGEKETVRLKGTTDAPSVRMFDTRDGTERSAGTGPFEFAWVGRDLNNDAGERTFQLWAPAAPETLGPVTFTEWFELRKDTELLPLRLWTAAPEVVAEDGGLRVRFTAPPFSDLERYELVLVYNKGEDEAEKVTIPLTAFDQLLPYGVVNGRMPGRGLPGVLISVRAITAPKPVRVMHQSPAVDLNVPFS